MSDYRNYIRVAAGFNGTTSEAAVYAGNKYAFTTASIGAVGIFTPLSIGRSNVASAVRVMLQGTVDPAVDTISVVNSSGQTRFAVPASIVSSGWLFLGPEDRLKITAPAATKADILVNDLDDAQLSQFILAEVEQAAITAFSDLYLPPIVTAVDPFVLPASISGKIQVIQTTGAAAQTVTLPLSSAVAVGTEVDMYNVSGNAHEIAPTGADLINNANAVFAVATTKRIIVKSFGPVIGWVVVLTA